ncbi:hypothetical protein AGMMS50222_01700 [Endomicrobiia bacterium]|nr:hypothetical protein AGMMS49531_02650 [Endomicrobiia bacterium]GHT63558.1 hypothetical protein AGMMS49556_00230 [Endomicrobiia bacterium]GHT68895.1 hypothetical protein AGMMS49950_00540 [Endomicrobiia bacterium]GHT73733.1 hypothetical protein AGMMS50222_01700 [Endomicrobiia bacterium]
MKKLLVALATCCGIVSQSFATETEFIKDSLKKTVSHLTQHISTNNTQINSW